MKSYICTICSTPCYHINMGAMDGPEPDICPYRGEAQWDEVNLNLGPIKDQLVFLEDLK